MKSINMCWSVATKLGLILTMLLMLSAGFAQTLGGTVIPNTAVASYRFSGKEQAPKHSNDVETVVPKHCMVNVTPDGSTEQPAYAVEAIPGDSFYLAYQMTNTGNTVNSFAVEAVLDSGVDLGIYSVILDSNGNGRFDEGEAEIDSVSELDIGETVNLLLKVVVSSSYAAHGSAFVNLIASCTSNSEYSDSNNIAKFGVPEGGISDLRKTANPANGSNVLPGDSISYRVSFKVNERDIRNVRISDKLSKWLDKPQVSVTVDGQNRAAVISYDEAGHMVAVRFSSLKAGSKVILTIVATVNKQTPGNEIIRNRADVSFDGGSETTNEVKHPVLAYCSVNISPDGSVAEPAYKERALPAETVVFAYEITNNSNATNTYNLAVNVAKQSDLEPVRAYVVIDANGNGKLDSGEEAVSSISLAMAETAKLLMVLELPGEYEASGDIFATPTASCDAGLPVPPGKQGKDENNIAKTTIPLGGFAAPEKKSSFPIDKPLYPGAKLTYSISFTVNDRDLSNVLVSDVLSDVFEAPSNISQGLISDSVSGLSTTAVASYDSASHSISWSFAHVPATMTVTVSFDVVVKSDVIIKADSTITNIAKIKSDNVEEKSTNPVTHKLKPINIIIDKTVDKTEVAVGQELEYSLKVTNPLNSVGLDKLVVVDDLPEVLEYIPGSTIITMPDGSTATIEPTVEDKKTTWDLAGIEPGETLLIKFRVLVLPAAIDAEEIVNIATAKASDSHSQAESKSESSVATVVQLGIFQAPAVLLGTVYTDVNDNDVFDEDVDQPQEAARIYLSDGRSVLTDELGRYSFVNMEAGIEAVKIDESTIPSRLLKETISEISAGQWLVRLEQGLITRLDIPLLDPKAEVVIRQGIHVTMGPITLDKTIRKKGEVVYVAIDISSSQSLKDLKLIDNIPADAKVICNFGKANTKGLEIKFGDIEAGFSKHFVYRLELAESFTGLYKAPAITWSVR